MHYFLDLQDILELFCELSDSSGVAMVTELRSKWQALCVCEHDLTVALD